MALFRLVGNPHNEMAWFRVLQLLEGVGPVTARRTLDALVAGGGGGAGGGGAGGGGAGGGGGGPGGGGPGAALAGWESAREHLPAGAREPADGVVRALRRAVARDGGAGAHAEGLRDALAPLIKARYADGAIRLADLDHLVEAARESSDLVHFAGELALDPPQSSSDLAGAPHLDEDYLVLSTIHSAKGLEWDGVHVLAIYDGNFPACMSAGSKESIDEERRLLYVAVTRARRQLHLYVPVRYYHRPQGIDDAHGYGKPSRFLTSEVQQTCEVLRLDDPVLSASVLRSGPLRKITVSVDSLFS